MARATLTPVTPVGGYPALQPAANSLDFAFAACDASNGNQFLASGDDLILAQNTGAGARTLTITSAADPVSRRTGDITTYSIGAGEFAAFRVNQLPGWRQSDGYIYLTAEHAEVKVAVMRLAA